MLVVVISDDKYMKNFICDTLERKTKFLFSVSSIQEVSGDCGLVILDSNREDPEFYKEAIEVIRSKNSQAPIIVSFNSFDEPDKKFSAFENVIWLKKIYTIKDLFGALAKATTFTEVKLVGE